MRVRKFRRPRPPRRGVQVGEESCVRLVPPGHDDVLVAICETVGLWRIKAYEVDRHGLVSPSGELVGFVEAMLESASALEAEHPDLAASFAALAEEGE